VLSTALGFLTLYSDPVVAAVTSASDWRIGDLVTGDRPVSLYLVVPPSDISRTMPLMRLILNQIGRRLTEGRPDPARRRVLMMLDEFPALGRLDFFEKTLAFMAGYGVRAFLIAQSLNQIDKAYGPSNAILDNCHVRVAFATNDERTAKRISDALGTKTELRAQKNYTGHRLSLWLGHMMLSRQETARPLMTPGEVMQMPRGEAVVMVSGVPPIRAKKLKYYRDGNFTSRVLPAAAVGEANMQLVTGRSSQAHEDVEAGVNSGEVVRTSTGLQIEASFDSAAAKPEPHLTLASQTEPGPSATNEASANDIIKQAVALDLDNPDLMPGF
jgi:type IV secretion system protein VirD4